MELDGVGKKESSAHAALKAEATLAKTRREAAFW